MVAQPIERQGKYGRVSMPTKVIAGHLRTASAGAQLSSPVHRQLHRKAKDAAQRRSRRAARAADRAADTAVRSAARAAAADEQARAEQAIHTAVRAQGLPGDQMPPLASGVGFPVHPGHRGTQGTRARGEWLGTAGMSVSLLLLCIAYQYKSNRNAEVRRIITRKIRNCMRNNRSAHGRKLTNFEGLCC